MKTITGLNPILPRKRVSAGALFLNEAGHLLLVNPTYKPPWEIPGGMVELNETPLSACIREVAEEIGLTVMPEILLSVGYLCGHSDRGDSLRFIFWGGVLDRKAIAQIKLQESELSEFRFVTLDEAALLVRDTMHAQLTQCIANLTHVEKNNTIPMVYWEEK